MKKERVMIYVMSIGCIVTLVALCFSLGIFAQKKNKEVFQTISANDAIAAIKEKKEMVIYCGQETCSACRSFSPLLEKISIEEKKDIYYLDVDVIASQKELQKYQIQETPTLINISNGEVLIYRGTMDEEEIRKAILKNNVEKVELKGITSIDAEELVKIEQQAKDFILYIGREDCGDCQKFGPILNQYLSDNSAGVYYLSVKEYREKANKEDAKKEDIEKYENLKEKYELDWVPTLIHIRNGIQVSRYEFFDEEYGKLEADKKEEYEQDCITKFYEWMSRETQF